MVSEANLIGSLCAQAVRAVFRYKSRSALTALGITIGIAAVVWVVAIGRAGSERVEAQLHGLGDNLVWVEAGSRNINGVRNGARGTTTLTLEDDEAIAGEISTLTRVSPNIDGSILLVAREKTWTSQYRGVSIDYLDIKRWTISEGRAFTSEEVDQTENVCLIGATVKKELFGDERAVGQVVRVGVQTFRIVGLLEPKGQSASGQDQDDTVILPYTTAQKRLRGKGPFWLDDVLCSAASPQLVAVAARQITALLRQRHNIRAGEDDDFNIRHPEDSINAQLDASRTFALLLMSVAGVALLTGGVGVMNVMLASVVERTREIGLRVAVGAPRWAVRFQFIAEAVVLTLLGGVLGVLASAGGAFALTQFLGWPLEIAPQAVGIAIAFSVAVGVIFGSYPAWRAARLDPIHALRSD
jgi:putative ABC transport system permease protein